MSEVQYWMLTKHLSARPHLQLGSDAVDAIERSANIASTSVQTKLQTEKVMMLSSIRMLVSQRSLLLSMNKGKRVIVQAGSHHLGGREEKQSAAYPRRRGFRRSHDRTNCKFYSPIARYGMDKDDVSAFKTTSRDVGCEVDKPIAE